MTKQKNLTATDLLDKVIEFTEMTPDQEQWTLSALESNLPRFIRLQQINSLINAFLQNETSKTFVSDKPNLTINNFLSGKFIKERPTSDYIETFQFIRQFINEQGIALGTTSEIQLEELVFAYTFLIAYKRQLRNLLTFNNGWFATSSLPTKFTILLTNSITNNLVNKHSDLDKALELFINPTGLTFTETELIETYNYPIDDLDEIEIEFM